MNKLNLSDIGIKISQLNKETNKAELEIARLEGRQSGILNQLKEKFKTDDISELKNLLKEKETNLIKQEKTLEQLTNKLDMLMGVENV